MKNKKRLSYKDCTSRIQELISSEELISIYNLKAALERKEKNVEQKDMRIC